MRSETVLETGICTNARCSGPARRTPVEYYDGPGRFCPDCGEELERRPRVVHASAPAPLGLEARLREALMPPAPERRPPIRLAAIALATLGFVAAVVVGFLSWRALAVSARTVVARVCTTTITEHVGTQIARAYGAKNGVSPKSFDVRAAGNDACDVRFRVVSNTKGDPVIGHEGIVAIVNPANSLTRLSEQALRDIYSGRVRNWRELGGPSREIVPLMPGGDSDEASALDGGPLGSVRVGARVRRVPSSEITRFVASPSGHGAIGLVTFGSSVPAKVLGLGEAPLPNPLTIADGSYPLSRAIVIESDMRTPSAFAAALIAFARAPESQKILADTGLVPEPRH